ncbi:leucine--tRNA ligase [Chitinispirillales bacterium ANBcel5]|uniref:leucine--tRNA ligase n=1 Tax=Cellulosispirillum alkaliphilum TaxID=3039283 RepID=UPI002A503777|nr:leucine--tRNA ligase [Chitinispirillales bacterium ANBcel5]
MSAYNASEVEPKWQKRWRDAKLHKTVYDPEKPKYYALDMFPYPSGSGLHVGHCEGYTATDIITRYKRMCGCNVLHPMGWDAFGLPAENFAIKTGIHPSVTTEKAIANFRKQIDSIGFAYDWDREINTTDPSYYKWTQWIFLQLYKKGLAYEGFMPINWCPSCKTGLANEEVTGGNCERCGSQVERKDLRQWILKITEYADRLLEDLDEVDWPDSTLAMQRNWIGRSEGAEVIFTVSEGEAKGEQVKVFTTRPDTLYGATYMVLAPEHPLVEKITTEAQAGAVEEYKQSARKKSDLERTELSKEKSGVFTGGYALNPVNKKPIPVWIADYVLAGYGTGAIMAVPAHDERDFEFAQKYDIPIIQVVAPLEDKEIEKGKAFIDEGVNINSGDLDGLSTKEAKKKITSQLENSGRGKAAVSYRLRDWIFSRQRYWGEPIPVIHCEKCGVVPVPEKDLPVKLPEVDKYEPSGTGESPLANIEEWLNTECPTCGESAKRETNTMPQWAGSCWYYLRYIDPQNDSEPWSKDIEKKWMNVDLYVGGAEHAVLHLLYSRFWHKVLYDLGYVTTKEPFKKLRHQGTVLASTYRDSFGKYHSLDDIEFDGNDARLKETGEKLSTEVEKMAKSKLNGVNPDDVIAKYGADVLRLYEMFMGEFELPKPWDPRAIEGCSRLIKRIWRLVNEFKPLVDGDPNRRTRHKTIKKVTSDIESMKFNTAIAAIMEYVNELMSNGVIKEDLSTLARLIAPFAPHLGDEAWEKLGEKGFILNTQWPQYDESLVKESVVTVVVQVNGKLRANFKASRETSRNELEQMALSQEKVKAHTEGKTIKKVIVVPGKLVNIVVS